MNRTLIDRIEEIGEILLERISQPDTWIHERVKVAVEQAEKQRDFINLLLALLTASIILNILFFIE